MGYIALIVVLIILLAGGGILFYFWYTNPLVKYTRDNKFNQCKVIGTAPFCAPDCAYDLGKDWVKQGVCNDLIDVSECGNACLSGNKIICCKK